jgi:hypothetical protein
VQEGIFLERICSPEDFFDRNGNNDLSKKYKRKEMETIAPTPKETGKRESETEEQEHQHHIDILPPSSRTLHWILGAWGAGH